MSVIQVHSRTLDNEAFLIEVGEFRLSRYGYPRQSFGDPFFHPVIGLSDFTPSRPETSGVSALGPVRSWRRAVRLLWALTFAKLEFD